MRPINLIPEEDRPDGRRPLRTGPLPYVVVGILALAVIGLTLMVVTNGQILDRKSEVAQLEAEQRSAKAEAESLAPYTQFNTVREQRVTTMTSLADSRFDWPRVMRELSLVLPADVHLSSLSASASPESGEGEGTGMRAAIAGPALEVVGCASSQSSVAGFVGALKEIDGVTRVGVQSSAIGGSTESGSAVASTCAAGKSVAQFQMIVAFDAAPTQIEGESEEEAAAPAPAPEASTETTSGESTESSESSSSGEGGAE
ncbi:MAG TPA: PilN domain-containing protein [Solirubrobacterales bacterium]|jgi:Tfp pilus assembly protein PilN